MSASAVSSVVTEFMRRMPIFSDLSEASFETLSRSGKSLLKEKGQFIFYQGDPAETFFIVKSGQVSILLESADGREMVINEIQPGDFFGELGLITKKARSTSAVARKDTELLAIPEERLPDAEHTSGSDQHDSGYRWRNCGNDRSAFVCQCRPAGRARRERSPARRVREQAL